MGRSGMWAPKRATFGHTVRWLVLAPMLALPGCLPTRKSLEIAAPTTDSPLSVSEPKSGPRLATVTREGDPAGAITLAVAAPRAGRDGGLASRALAELIVHRMRLAGFDAGASADAAGLRVTVSMASDTVAEQVVGALHDALHQPVREPEVVEVVRALEATPLPTIAEPHVALAACSGDLGAPRGASRVVDRTSLEGARAEALRQGGIALGAVATKARTEALSRAVGRESTWQLDTRPAPDRGLASSHAVTVSALANEEATLELAFAVRDPRRALQLTVQEDAYRSPLSARLAVIDSPFRVTEVRGTARGDGGCVRIRLEAEHLPRERAPRIAAEALTVVATSVRRDLTLPLEPALVARQIVRSNDARTTAELAAWWGLAQLGAGPDELVTSSVLALPAERGDVDGRFLDLERSYRSQIAATPERIEVASAQAFVAAARTTVERGQGESWLLVGNECALAQEGDADSGRSALVARLAASPRVALGVTLEPWIEPAGVGILARSAALPGETATAHGRRLATAVGMALTSLPVTEGTFMRAKTDVLRLLASPAERQLEALLLGLNGLSPAWVRPHGLLEPQLATTMEDVEERWRAMLREPWRVAMVASIGAEEADATVAELSRWLGHGPTGPCVTSTSTAGERRAPQSGWAGEVLPPHGWLAVTSNDPKEAPIAEVIAAELEDTARRLGLAGHPMVLGIPRAPTVAVAFDGGDEARETAMAAWRRVLSDLRASGLTGTQLEQANQQVQRWRARSLDNPRGRLAALWRGDRMTPVTAFEVRSWLDRRIVPEHVVTVVGKPALP